MKDSLVLLFDWFLANKRDLPWRKERSFYRVWLSEVMLQQTQVKTVIPYYENFMKRFPRLEDLANTDLQVVLKEWEGLGYYSRARNLHKAAIQLSALEELPKSYEELIQISGFGPYTTAAVLSFTYNANYAVVDGNVKRVISRLFSLRDDISLEKTKEKIQTIVNDLLPENQSALFNESLMELGALICLPKSPQCRNCPLQESCKAFQEDCVAEIPFRAKRKKIPTKKKISFVFQRGNSVFVQKRGDQEMLASLWRFYTLEKNKRNSVKRLLKELDINSKYKKLESIKHSYSHFKLELDVYLIELREEKLPLDGKWIDKRRLENYPFDKASLKIFQQIT